MTYQNEWELCENREGVIESPNGTRLFMVAKGAPRSPNHPVVIFESGLGVSGAHWTAVQRLLDPRIRSYAYDRAGYGNSPESKKPRSAANMAAELLDVLQAAKISPPYIVVAHSYGGIIAREFLATADVDAIAGMVLVDTNQENTHPRLSVPFSAIQALCGGRDYPDVIGLFRDTSWTQEELDRIAIDGGAPTTASTMEQEASLLLQSSIDLGEKNQLDARPLGMRPVTVIRGDSRRDFQRLRTAAQEGNCGTKEQLQEMDDFLENRFDVFDRELQMNQLRLSGNSRFVQATNSGHAVMATEPQLIADEILAIWDSSI
ncbi:uncharacterized protein N7479_009456 [Penicillium vulpinum]|uniref:AB hydrolase-1 domain-containing protein n=1 Tax=Penicillium vulpinum TaxID=29845 RepID=A0A1V6R403_9EURO|nr:uncharacterized protein N7479_009456 [Penicillium vulpinum]KAJ5951043.1 hypothetical protein N7479_009456 [Penicillium vulpinum]OQD96193.1 hypothetical protein PENVUL_c097G05520 [Penicillium vulpinum]